jgi:hypothetical protein
MGKLRSNRVKRTPQTGITSDRYQFLGLEQAEPNLGDALVGPSSVGVNSIKAGTFYQLAAIGQYPGERFWSSPVGIGTSLGVISVYANDVLPSSAFQRIHGLNFVGAGVTLETPPLELFDGIGIATVRFTVTDILNRGQVGQVLYNTPSGYAYGADGLYYVSGNVGIGSTIPKQSLDVSGNGYFSGIVTAFNFVGNLTGNATTATNVIGGIASVSQLYVSGISTLGVTSTTDLSSRALVVSGVSTLGITSTTNLSSNSLSVSGISTLGVTSTTNLTSKSLSVSGISTLGVTSTTDLSSNSLIVSGVSTLGIINASNGYFSGIVTASKFVGTFDGTIITNAATATTAYNVIGGIASVTSLSVSGISTLGIISASNAFLTGIVTASKFVGTFDGPVLSNVATATTAYNVIGGIASVSQLYVSGISTFANGPLLIGTETYIDNPNQLLQVNSGAYISGNLGIGTTNPGEALQVDGNIRVGNSVTSNYIAFRGVYGDGAPGTTPPIDQVPYSHAFIGERIYEPGTEHSELLLFKGNDVGSPPGPDRIRLASTGSIVFDTTSVTGVLGTFDAVGASTNFSTKMSLTSSGRLGIGSTLPRATLDVQGNLLVTGISTFGSNLLPSTTGLSIGDSSNRWENFYVNNIIGNLTGAASSIAVSQDLSTDIARYITFVDVTSGISTIRTSTSLTFNPSAGNLGIGSTLPKVALDVGVGSVYISNGDTWVNGTQYTFNTRNARDGFWTNGGLDGGSYYTNVAPGGPVGFRVKIPGIGATTGTFGAIDDTNLYATMSTRHNGTEGITDFRGLLGIGTTTPLTPLQVEIYGVKTGFGTFIASAGISTDVDSFLISNQNFKTAEYTIHIESSNSIQAQKVLVMQNGASAFSQEYAIMSNPTFMVSIGATVSGGLCKLQFTPESGISGLMTYRFTRQSML